MTIFQHWSHMKSLFTIFASLLHLWNGVVKRPLVHNDTEQHNRTIMGSVRVPMVNQISRCTRLMEGKIMKPEYVVSSYFTKKHRESRSHNSRSAIPMIPFDVATCAFDTSAGQDFCSLETRVTIIDSSCLSGVLGWTHWRRFGGSTSVSVDFPISKRDGPRCWVR